MVKFDSVEEPDRLKYLDRDPNISIRAIDTTTIRLRIALAVMSIITVAIVGAAFGAGVGPRFANEWLGDFIPLYSLIFVR